MADGSGLIWDLDQMFDFGKPTSAAATDKDALAWWGDLASEDARRAYQAIWQFVDHRSLMPFVLEP